MANRFTNITDYVISDRFFRSNRWYVKLKSGAGRRVMAYAVFVWLKANPSFHDVPKGYVVHHLDCDPLNDDPTNLVIMQKNYHSAYHLKYKNVETLVRIDETNGLPAYQPKVYFMKNRNRYFIQYLVRLPNGKTDDKRIFNLGSGKNFKTREMAEQAIETLWPGMVWDK